MELSGREYSLYGKNPSEVAKVIILLRHGYFLFFFLSFPVMLVAQSLSELEKGKVGDVSTRIKSEIRESKKLTYEVKIMVDSRDVKESNMMLSYLVGNCGWSSNHPRTWATHLAATTVNLINKHSIHCAWSTSNRRLRRGSTSENALRIA